MLEVKGDRPWVGEGWMSRCCFNDGDDGDVEVCPRLKGRRVKRNQWGDEVVLVIIEVFVSQVGAL